MLGGGGGEVNKNDCFCQGFFFRFLMKLFMILSALARERQSNGKSLQQI